MALVASVRSPDERPEEAAHPLDRSGREMAKPLGMGEGQRLRQQLAEEDGDEADDGGHDDQRQGVGIRRQERGCSAKNARRPAVWLSAAKADGEQSHEGDADLDDGQEASRAGR